MKRSYKTNNRLLSLACSQFSNFFNFLLYRRPGTCYEQKCLKKHATTHTHTRAFLRSADGFKNIKQNIIQIILLFRRRSQEHVVKTNNNRVKYNIIMKIRKSVR